MAYPQPAPGQALPIPQKAAENLTALGESSTGSWERGRLHGNARSPPEQTRLVGSKALQEVDAKYTRSFSERPQREGYGFRPTSGSSTPLTEGAPSTSLAWPGRQQQPAKTEQEEGEQILDISPSALNSIRSLNLGGSGLPRSGLETPIPDAHGLGWPGESTLCVRSRLTLQPNQLTFGYTRPRQSHPPTLTSCLQL